MCCPKINTKASIEDDKESACCCPCFGSKTTNKSPQKIQNIEDKFDDIVDVPKKE